MTITFKAGDEVRYEHDLGEGHIIDRNYSQFPHFGTVAAIEVDGVNGAQIVTVEFDCGLTQDIPGDELKPAEPQGE